MPKNKDGREKSRRYAATAERRPMPRPAVFSSKKAYNRKRNKAVASFE